MKIFKILCLLVNGAVMSESYRGHLSDAWYPQNAKKLRLMINNMQRYVKNNWSCDINPKNIKAILVPHAAYQYSGNVAVSAYQNLKQGSFKRIVILAPGHHVAIQGVALPSTMYDSYRDVMGNINLDVAMIKKLIKAEPELFLVNQKAYDIEHSLEVQMPLIATYCPGSKIVPLIIGNINQQQLKTLVKILKTCIDDQTLLIATSDLVHFGPSFKYKPFTHDVLKQLVDLDTKLIASIQNLNVAQFLSDIDTSGATVCGIQPIQVLLELLNSTESPIISYVTGYDRSSGDQKNPEHSVSYVGIVFTHESPEKISIINRLTGYEKNVLRQLVKLTLDGLSNLIDCGSSYLVTQALQSLAGVFVTLYTPDHQLRGCIGTVKPQDPLYLLVCHMARAAALGDKRFEPLKPDQIDDIQYVVSVLTEPRSVSTYQDIRLGIDGVILKYKNKSSLFLPKVAEQYQWDLETMLGKLCQKAGLDFLAWKNKDMTFEVFQSIDF